MPLNRERARAVLNRHGISTRALQDVLVRELATCVDERAIPVSNEPHQFAGTMLIPAYCLVCNVHESRHA